jgi:hypothetical protein
MNCPREAAAKLEPDQRHSQLQPSYVKAVPRIQALALDLTAAGVF